MAKRFFYVCAGIFLLALTYHLGARSVGAQSGSPVSAMSAFEGSSGLRVVVMTPNGDCFMRTNYPFQNTPPPVYFGNYWDVATSGRPESWGQMKDRYRR
jgi:hypothetical protein